jgi:hypothetical protein
VRPPDPIGGAAARHAAQQELRRGEYHRDDPSLFDRALRWLGHRIGDLFSGSAPGNIALLFVVLVGALAIFLVARAGSVPRRSGRAGPVDPLAPEAAIDHRRLAIAHQDAGRWAEALREWLRATIRSIEERGVLDPVPGRTAAATAREAGAVLPDLAARLTIAMDTFDAVWFGGRPATAADVDAAARLADAIARAPIPVAPR